ncbi:Kae1-associated serine/threonine protein kinase [Candidatus Woesearchaeota archaeon]|nr:Kae1-associated serine/threonine protein kinase [Candidatus Woesearchaeota archaeon]
MIEIARGAEAVIYEDAAKGVVVKDRVRKGYRHPELDAELRSQRTKREANLLKKLKIPRPNLVESDGKERIVMERIKGEKVREALDKDPKLARKIGSIVAQMHDSHVIHGDLTTSNILIGKDGNLVFIDFGLSFQSHKVEDKAVDIHLFKQALESKHFKVYDEALKEFLAGYRKAEGYGEIMKRLEEVEARGRYRKG